MIKFMFHVKDFIKRRPNTLVIQQRESQIALNNANQNIQTRYEGMIPKRPHGTLPLSPAMGPDEKLFTATFTSQPGKLIQNRCIPFTDENNEKKYFTIEHLALKDYEQMSGPDFISSKDDSYFGKATQEAFRAELLRLKSEGAIVPVCYLKEDGTPGVKYLPAKEVIHDYFDDKTYANERDEFSLLLSDVKEATSKINDIKEGLEIKDEKVDLEIKVEPSQVPGTGPDDGTF